MNGGNLIVFLCGIAALLSSIVSNFWCRTITFKPASNYGITSGLPDVSYGIWTQREIEFYEVEGEDGDQTTLYSKNTCKLYSSSVNIDATWKVARAFSIIAPTIGAFLAASSIFGSSNIRRWRFSAVMIMIFVTLFQGLTLLLFKSSACQSIPLLDEVESNQVWSYMISLAYPGSCQFASGSVATIVATLLWFLTGLSMLVVGPRKLDEETNEAKYNNFSNT